MREAHLVIVCFIKFSTSYNSQCLKITRNVSCFKYLNFRTKMTPVDFDIGFWHENSKFLKWKPLLDVRLFEAFSNTMQFRLKLNGFNCTFVWILSFILSFWSFAVMWSLVNMRKCCAKKASQPLGRRRRSSFLILNENSLRYGDLESFSSKSTAAESWAS